ncbi:IS5 family transposase [Wolinella succinogenes]|uniref:IS5 family transposase n=1 Tax=Wolinella succinogenes TaxID=844 RepID=UPI00240A099D|nr:IS5 family transposase [Wolinella succinogenes]
MAKHLAIPTFNTRPTREDCMASLYDRWFKCSSKKRGEDTGRSSGGITTKRHLVSDAKGLPLAIRLSSGNRHDMSEAIPTIESIKVPRVGRGAPKTRPARLLADKGYDSKALRTYLTSRGIKHTIPKRTYENPKPRVGRPLVFDALLYKCRWTVERVFSHLNSFRRIAVRYDHKKASYLGFLQVAAIMLTLRNF